MGKLTFQVLALALAGFPGLAFAQQPPAQNPSAPSPSVSAEAAPASLQDLQLEQTGGGDKAKPTPQGNARAVPVQSTEDAPEIVNAELRPIEGELEQKIDSKTAKVGDAVTLRTTDIARTSDGEVIPKGSRLVGRVVEVASAEKDSDNAKITIQFEKAELKDSKTLIIKSVVQSVAPASADGAAVGRSSSGAGASAAAGAPRGDSESPMGGSAVVNEGPQDTAASRVTPARIASASNTAPRVGTVVAQQGNVAIKTTAIPGVLIATDANGQPFSNASGVLLGSRQNVHLDSGTLMVLAVADQGTQEPTKKLVPTNRPRTAHRSKPAK